MPIDVLLNDDLKKLAVSIHDRQHYLTVLETDTLLAELKAFLASEARKGPVELHGLQYTIDRAQATELDTQVKSKLNEFVALAGRPEPPADAKAKITALSAENEELKRRLAEWEAKHPDPKTVPNPIIGAGKR